MNAIEKIMRRPGVAHILATNDRYNKRLGPQFAAAITYFSILSMVPILMFAVSMLGLTLTVLRPDWFDLVQSTIKTELEGTSIADSVGGVVEHAFKNWRTIGLVALLTAAYSGTNWVGNLKKAFRVMWRDRFSDAAESKNFFLDILSNLLTFFGLLLCFAAAVTVTSGGGTFSSQVINWLGLGEVPGITIILRVVSIALTFVASWLLFAFVFLVLPGERTNRRTWLIGVTAGAVLTTVLQQIAGLLVSLFTKNATAGIFGSVIVLMLVLNLLATIILMIGAWVGTADSWQKEQLKRDAEKAAGTKQEDAEVEVDDGAAGAAAPAHTVPREPEPEPHKSWADQRREERWAARKPLEQLRAATYDPTSAHAPDPGQPVPAEVAARGMKVGMGVGYGLGAATGVGLGAVIAALIAKLFRRD